MKLYWTLVVVIVAVLTAQQSRACAPSCAGASIPSQQVVKTIERVVVSGVEEAQWRGICHSFCITVSSENQMSRL